MHKVRTTTIAFVNYKKKPTKIKHIRVRFARFDGNGDTEDRVWSRIVWTDASQLIVKKKCTERNNWSLRNREGVRATLSK